MSGTIRLPILYELEGDDGEIVLTEDAPILQDGAVSEQLIIR